MLTLIFVMSAAVLIGEPVNAAPIPPAPTGLHQTGATSGSVKFEWNAVVASGDVHYDIQYATSPNGPWAYEYDDHEYHKTTEESITGLSSGSRYYVRVRAYIRDTYDTFTDGPWSQPIDVVTPKDSSATLTQTGCTTNTISLSWSNAGSDMYRVYWRAGGSDQEASVDVSQNSATISNLIPGKQYYAHVVPIMKSSTYAAVTTSYIPNASVKTISTTPTCSVPSTYWNIGTAYIQPSNYETTDSDGFEYELYSYKNKKIISGSYTGYLNVSLNNKYFKKYQFFKVRVRNYVTLNNGTRVCSQWSPWVWSGRNPDITKVRRSGSNAYKLNWKTMRGATSYTVYASTSEKSGFKKVATTKKTSYVVTKFKKKVLKRNKRYYFYVVANKKSGKKTFKTTPDRSFYLYD